MSILHITTELVNTPTKQPYYTFIYSLVNGLYKIITESIKLIEQFGASSDLIIPTHDVQKVSSFFLSSSTHHSMDSTEMPLTIFQPRIYHKV